MGTGVYHETITTCQRPGGAAMINQTLPLYEEILLLALDDQKGTPSLGGFFANAMGGAILAELAMNGSITIAGDKDKKVQFTKKILTLKS